MGAAPPAELRPVWLSAVLLPGYQDPVESCLAELAEYTGLPPEEVRARCSGAVEEQRRQWNAGERRSADDLVAFYNGCDAYLYELLWWHALQQGEAPAWNARLVDIAARHGVRRYLDFGGGIGTNAILLAQRGIEVTVADVSDVLLAFARWRLRRRGLSATFIDLKTTELGAESYDMISAVDVLEHVADPLATLANLHRALSPRGILVFDHIASKFDADRPFHLLRSKYPIRSRIRGLGFTHLESFQKYLVYRKAARTRGLDDLVRSWDIVRWRAYYLLRGQWPRVESTLERH